MRRRHQQQEPIVCDEISQHGLGSSGNSNAVPIHEQGDGAHTISLLAFGPDTSCTRAASPTTSASSTDDLQHITHEQAADGEAKALRTQQIPVSAPRETSSTEENVSAIVRAEPQVPSCRADQPKQSCMIVKSQDESVHSMGLSHHRPSGKRSNSTAGITASTAAATTLGSGGVDGDLSVSFSTIDVREFPVVVGDNPSTSAGPPISISWNPNCELSIDIEEFEDYRNGEGYGCCRRRTGESLRLDAEQRRYMALNGGSSYEEISAAVRQNHRVQRNRARPANRSKHAFDIVKESATRKLKRLILRQKKDSSLYDEFMHTAARRRALAEMTIAEEEAEDGVMEELGCDKQHLPATPKSKSKSKSTPASAIVIQEDSTHRGSAHYYDGQNRISGGTCMRTQAE